MPFGRRPGSGHRLGPWLALFAVGCGGTEPTLVSGPRLAPVAWTIAGRGFGTPTLSANTVYFTTASHEVLAVDKSSGRVRWRSKLPVDRDVYFGKGGVLAAGTLVIGDQDLFGLDTATGAIRWRFRPQRGRNVGLFQPSASSDTVFTGSSSGHAFAISAGTGLPLWEQQVVDGDTANVNRPALGDRDLYLGISRRDTGYVAALSRSTGEVRWIRPVPATVPAAGTTATYQPILAGSVVVANSQDGGVFGIRAADGSVAWALPPVAPPVPPATYSQDIRPLGYDGRLVFIGSTAPTLIAVDPATGRVEWTYRPALGIQELSVYHSQVVITFGGGIVGLLAANSGQLVFRGPDTARATGEPAVDSARVYVAGGYGLFALRR